MLEQAVQRISKFQAQKDHEAMLARLTAREQQVLERIVAGRRTSRSPTTWASASRPSRRTAPTSWKNLEVTTVADLMKVALAKPEAHA